MTDLTRRLQQQQQQQQEFSRDPSLKDSEILKIDQNFQKLLAAHPNDSESLINGHFMMVLYLPNHPLAKKTEFQDWVNTWFIPYIRVEKPSSKIINQAAEIIPDMMSKLVDAVMNHYKFLKKGKQDSKLFQHAIDAIMEIVWRHTFDNFFGLILCKAYAVDDANLAAKIMSVAHIQVSDLNVRKEFWLEPPVSDNDPPPYASAIYQLQRIVACKSVNSKLACLKSTANKLIESVNEYWDKKISKNNSNNGDNTTKKPDVNMAADELLPLTAFIIIKANIPNAHAESSFLELFIDDQKAIEQEGYLLATFQTALGLIMQLDEDTFGKEQQQSPQPLSQQQSPQSPSQQQSPQSLSQQQSPQPLSQQQSLPQEDQVQFAPPPYPTQQQSPPLKSPSPPPYPNQILSQDSFEISPQPDLHKSLQRQLSQ